MNAKLTRMRPVSTDEQQTVAGGFDAKAIVDAVVSVVRDLTSFDNCNKACADSKGQVQSELQRFR